jgi:hypothetical protein
MKIKKIELLLDLDCFIQVTYLRHTYSIVPDSFIVDTKNESIFFTRYCRQHHAAPQAPSFRPD